MPLGKQTLVHTQEYGAGSHQGCLELQKGKENAEFPSLYFTPGPVTSHLIPEDDLYNDQGQNLATI